MAINHGTNLSTIGRGRLYFSRFTSGTDTATGELYLGNTPEFNLSLEPEKLEHFSSEEGLKVKDNSVLLQISRSGSFITDHISIDNVELFFFGNAETVTQDGTPVADEAITVIQGRHYQLGSSGGTRPGVNNVSAVSVQDETDTTTYVEDTDYSLDAVRGRIYIIPGGAIADDDVIHVDYTPAANTRTRVVSQQDVIYGALRFISNNPTGSNNNHFFPKVELTPSGDYALKGDDWQQMSFNVDLLKLDDATAFHYIDGQPA